ncbi:putative membrane protein YhhN [Novosphingobium kunmingense]|uniref:Putative membrane protein YhhN n=1 Tax=Novosphingobium kunmingense TaxID=1211806 RepID=A0A2N0I2V8_9SPHN|nr:lysoplasmalogenase [Novosphingobium kunmingense]PKB25495.1 putative membrane protein YhhN [Novosphingobium kunmingense]
MPKRALIQKRPWLVASLVASISYYFVRNGAVPDLFEWLLKGAGVALLVVYALARHGGNDSRTIAAVMACGALGDVLIEYRMEAGAAAFLVGHLVAMALYLRHRRTALAASQRLLALVLLVAIPVIAWLLPADRGAALPVAFYSLALAGMVACAWTSSFSRYQVGLGAVMFAVSDLLIFARMGPLADSIVPNLLIWPLYYFGQFLICTGVVGELRRRSGATKHGIQAL